MSSFLDPLLVRNPPSIVLAVKGEGDIPLATTVETAFDSKSRTKGLLGRPSLAPGVAMILAPCQAIHTFKMQFAIDVVFVGRDGKVLKINPNLVPSRLAMAPRAFATIEMAAGETGRFGLRTGDTLILRAAEL